MRRLAALVGLALLAPAPARGYLDDTSVGARGAALGSAALAVTSDASAYYWNPAGLAGLRRSEALADYAKPYGVPDLNVGTLAVAGVFRGTGLAAAWHRLSIADVYGEDVFYLAAGREVWRAGRHRLDGGATFKYGRLSFEPFADPDGGGTVEIDAQAKGAVDVGLKWVTPWRIDLAWVGRDLNRPKYQLVAGTGGDRLDLRHEIAAALRWNPESVMLVGWTQEGDGAGTFNAGIEIEFYEVFTIRSGVSNLSQVYQAYGSPNDLQYTGGFGINHRGYWIDAAATTNHDLGASYRVTLRVPFGREAAE